MINLLKKMSETDQIPGKQSVLAHGESVSRKLKGIVDYLGGNNEFPLGIAPIWIEENKKLFLSQIYSERDLFLYTLFHDCGKPFCLEKDEYG